MTLFPQKITMLLGLVFAFFLFACGGDNGTGGGHHIESSSSSVEVNDPGSSSEIISSSSSVEDVGSSSLLENSSSSTETTSSSSSITDNSSSSAAESSSSVTAESSSSGEEVSSSSVTEESSSSNMGSSSSSIASSGTFTDTRDAKVYKYVKIGDQIWMAENLNYETPGGSWCNEEDNSNCDLYGRLYEWVAAMRFDSSCNDSKCLSQIQAKHRGVCPEDWHLPSREEWNALVNFVGDSAGVKLKSTSGWDSSFDGNGTDDYGFNALPGGARRYSDNSFENKARWGNWWAATEDNSFSRAGYQTMGDTNVNVDGASIDKNSGFSVRCIKN